MQVEMTIDQIKRLIEALKKSRDWRDNCLANYLEQHLPGKQVWTSDINLDEIPF